MSNKKNSNEKEKVKMEEKMNNKEKDNEKEKVKMEETTHKEKDNEKEKIEDSNQDMNEPSCDSNECSQSSKEKNHCCKDEKSHENHSHHHHLKHHHHHHHHHHHCSDIDHVQCLRVYLADLLVAKHAIYGIHWHVKGNGFLRLHKFTEEVYEFIIERYDVIAERIIQLGHSVPHNPCEQLKHRTIPHIDFEFINPRDGWHLLKFYLRQLVKYVNHLHNHMDKCHHPKDKTTSIILDDDLTSLDKFLWLTKSSCPCNDLPTVVEPKLAEIYKELKKH